MTQNNSNIIAAPRLLVAGLSGGSGKTLVSLGLCRAFARRGLRVASFKKGPDYIDTAWLGLAAHPAGPGWPARPGQSACSGQSAPSGQPASFGPHMAASVPGRAFPDWAGRNLDLFFTPRPEGLLLRPFLPRQGDRRARDCRDTACRQPDYADEGADLALIEGNRGLFDGRDLDGSCSSAALARLLGIPVILVLSAGKMTRTAAAIVQGCKMFEPGLNLAGVVINRASRPRHRALVKQAVEELAGVPVFGLLPRLPIAPLEERGSGLVLNPHHGPSRQKAEEAIEQAANLIEKHLDLEGILKLARSAPPFTRQAAPGGVSDGPAWPDGPAWVLGTPDKTPQDGWSGIALDKTGQTATPVAPSQAELPGTAEAAEAAEIAEKSGTAGLIGLTDASGCLANAPGCLGAAPGCQPHASDCRTDPAGIQCSGKAPLVGYLFDPIFPFGYVENLEALQQAGARLMPLSLHDAAFWHDWARARSGSQNNEGVPKACGAETCAPEICVPEICVSGASNSQPLASGPAREFPQGLYFGGACSLDALTAFLQQQPGLQAGQQAGLQGGQQTGQQAGQQTGQAVLQNLRVLVESGLPVYAEYGGLLCLGHSLRLAAGTQYPLAGVFPLDFSVTNSPQGLGYSECAVLAPNPFHPVGATLRGHEFHYLRVEAAPPQGGQLRGIRACLRMQSGHGLGFDPALGNAAQNPARLQTAPNPATVKAKSGRQTHSGNDAALLDGLLYKNCFASMQHLFAPACPWWAKNFVALL